MALFFWQKGKLVEAFARTLADDVSSLVRPEAVVEYLAFSSNHSGANTPVADPKKGVSKSSKKALSSSVAVERHLNEVIQRVSQFKNEQSLGVYRKARLHQLFADRLTELGFPPEVVSDINRLILMQTP